MGRSPLAGEVPVLPGGEGHGREESHPTKCFTSRECLGAGDGGRTLQLLTGSLHSGMLPGTVLWDGPAHQKGSWEIEDYKYPDMPHTCYWPSSPRDASPCTPPAPRHVPGVPEPSPASCPWAQPRAGRTAATSLQTEVASLRPQMDPRPSPAESPELVSDPIMPQIQRNLPFPLEPDQLSQPQMLPSAFW